MAVIDKTNKLNLDKLSVNEKYEKIAKNMFLSGEPSLRGNRFIQLMRENDGRSDDHPGFDTRRITCMCLPYCFQNRKTSTFMASISQILDIMFTNIRTANLDHKNDMKNISYSLFLVLFIALSFPVFAEEVTDTTPPISLFDSVERIKTFLKDEAKQNYDDKYLSGITLKYFDGHPRKGLAWVYSFSFKRPRLGGDVSIFHYMDGQIIEFHHGP